MTPQHPHKGVVLRFDAYEIEGDGSVFGRRGAIVQSVGPNGYLVVDLHHESFGTKEARSWQDRRAHARPRTRSFAVHRLVCWTFHGAPACPKHVVRHLNGERTDNRAENLAWGTATENALDTIRHARARAPRVMLPRDALLVCLREYAPDVFAVLPRQGVA